MTARDFWRSSPTELWWQVETHTPKATGFAGGMSEDEVRAIYELHYGSEAE